MPRGVFIRTQEIRDKISKSHIGIKHTEETKKKMSVYRKGKPSSRGMTGKKQSKKFINAIKKSNTGVKFTNEHKKKLSDAHIGMFTGDKSHFWKGGISNTGYPKKWNERLKNLIREMDNLECQICKIKQEELIGRIKKLHVHHINYNKNNCDPNNLITLCPLCHGKTNINREYWIKYFENNF